MDDLQTGDIILFSGDSIISSIIRLTTFSRYSHIGIVLKNPDFLLNGEKLEGLYLLHSDGPYSQDLETGSYIYGVQISLLEDKIKSYNGLIGYRKLKSVDGNYDNDYMKKHIGKIYTHISSRPYNLSMTSFLKAIYNSSYYCKDDKPKEHFDLLPCVESNLRTGSYGFFCSSLVAFIYMSLGYISLDNFDWVNCIPDFFAKNIDKFQMLSPEFYLDKFEIISNTFSQKDLENYYGIAQNKN